MEKYTDQHGREWIEPSCCSVGDYAGAGTVGRSNIDYILEHFADHVYTANMGKVFTVNEFWKVGRSKRIDLPEEAEDAAVLHLRGGHASEEILVRFGVIPELDEIVDALEDYPVIEDNALIELECRLEEEQVLDDYYFLSSLFDEAEKRGFIRDKDTREELETYAKNLDEDTKWTLYRDSCDETNSYVWFENFSACFDYRALAPVYLRRLIEMYKSHLATLNHDTTGAL